MTPFRRMKQKFALEEGKKIMCALGQNKLLIYFPDKVNTSGAKQPASLAQCCCGGHNSVFGNCGSKVSNGTAHASVIIVIFTPSNCSYPN